MSQSAGSYYHNAIVYPMECKNDFKKLGCAYVLSPLHSPDAINGEAPKIHHHIMFRCGRKMTGDAFQGMCVDKLGPEFGKGFAYSPKECVVTAPEHYLRYMIHLDDLDKQQFKADYLELETYGVWVKEFLSAFDDIITRDILCEIEHFRTSVTELKNNPLYCAWLRKGYNLNLVNTIRREMNH